MSERVKYARRASGRVSSYAVDSEGDSTDEDEAVHQKKRHSQANKGRGKGKRTRPDASEDDDSTAGEASDESDSPSMKKKKPRKKRAKKSDGKKKKQPGKRRKLETIQMLPLEMLGEIFSHVGSNTLLALRLVNKHFHAFLSAKDSEPIWKAARLRVGLPDIEDLPEMQYAELVFGKTCQGCYGDKIGKIYRDDYLRKTFCKRCRRLKMVSVPKLSHDAPDVAARLHPFAVACVIRSAHSGTRVWCKWHSSRDFANLHDLWHYDRILRDLDDKQDDDSDVADEREPVHALRHEPSRRARSSNRPSRQTTTKRLSYKEENEGEDEDDSTQSFSRRAKEYADARKGLIDRVHQARPKLLQAQVTAADFLIRERDELVALKRPPGERYQRYQQERQCRAEVQRRLLEDDPSLDRKIFDSRYWSSEVQRLGMGASITDEGWSQIKPQARAACARIAPKLAADELADKQRTHSFKLRPRYNELLESLEKAARPFVPLSTDFLLLPSVKELWTPGASIDDAKWAAQLPLIKEELDDYRLELVLHARREILAATSDPATQRQDDADAMEDADSLDDAFFQLATSFVCCAFAGCPDEELQRRRWHWTASSSLADDKKQRKGWIGPLVEVLQHQHRLHNSFSYLSRHEAKASYPPFRVSLPLEVACGIESLLELHRLDDSKAKKRHLDEASKKSAGYEWVNSGLTRRYFTGKDAWWHMLALIKREGAKAAKCQLFLVPPEIRFRRLVDKKLVIDVDDDEQAGANARKA